MTVPAIRTALSTVVPLVLVAVPLIVIDPVAELPPTLPLARYTPLRPALTVDRVLPVKVNGLTAPVLVMAPPTHKPSSLLLVPVMLRVPLVVKVEPPLMRQPRTLVAAPAANAVALPSKLRLVPLKAVALADAYMLKAPNPLVPVKTDASLIPVTELVVLKPPVPVVEMLPPFQA